MTDTRQQLRDQVQSIAADIANPTAADWWTEHKESNYGEEPSAYDYLADALDIEYTVNSSGEYISARVLVAYGGPNIWINTRTKTVEGAWWLDKASAEYDTDAIGLDEALEELWQTR